jgi:hypothetical protein
MDCTDSGEPRHATPGANPDDDTLILRVLLDSRRIDEPLEPRPVAHVSNGSVQAGDIVSELPAEHHLQPCECVLCGSERPTWRVQSIGERDGHVFLVREDGYQCPASEVERVSD